MSIAQSLWRDHPELRPDLGQTEQLRVREAMLPVPISDHIARAGHMNHHAAPLAAKALNLLALPKIGDLGA